MAWVIQRRGKHKRKRKTARHEDNVREDGYILKGDRTGRKRNVLLSE